MAEDARHGGTLLETALERASHVLSLCSVAVALREHADRADEIRELLDASGSRISYALASATLRQEGINVGPQAIGRHKRSVCQCRS